MINCLVLDDEHYSIDVLVHHIKQTPFLNLVDKATHPATALQLIIEKNVHLLFCDIQMPDISGLDVIKALQGSCKVILTTAHSQFAMEGYELNVVDYLLKPISYPRFLAAVQKAHDLILASKSSVTSPIQSDFIFVKTGIKGQVQRINLTEITYIESMKNYVSIHHAGRKILVYLGIAELEKKLPAEEFFRVHKRFIVPFSQITGVEGNKILLKDLTADIVLGDTYRHEFLNRIHDKTLGK